MPFVLKIEAFEIEGADRAKSNLEAAGFQFSYTRSYQIRVVMRFIAMFQTVRFLIVLFVLLCSVHAGLAQSQEGQPFPEFELQRFDGGPFSSQEFSGRVTIVNFWATWCAPCRVEIPWFTEFKKQYADRGFEIIGVTLDGESTEAVEGFVRDLKINYPILTADEEIVEAIGGLIGVSTTFILDGDGRVALRHVGLANKKQLLEKIEDLLK